MPEYQIKLNELVNHVIYECADLDPENKDWDEVAGDLIRQLELVRLYSRKCENYTKD